MIQENQTFKIIKVPRNKNFKEIVKIKETPSTKSLKIKENLNSLRFHGTRYSKFQET